MKKSFAKSALCAAMSASILVGGSASALYVSDDGGVVGGAGGGGGFGGGTLEPVVITGSAGALNDWVIYQNLDMSGVGITLYSRDIGITIATEEELKARADKAAADAAAKKKACVDGCGAIQAVENNLCDSRAASITGMADVAAIGVYYYVKWRSKKILPGEPPPEPSVIYIAGQMASSAYASICKGAASSRYASCVTGTCKGP